MFQLTNMSHVEGTSRIPFQARMYSSMDEVELGFCNSF